MPRFPALGCAGAALGAIAWIGRRGIYRVEASGQMLTRIATFERPRGTDRARGGD